MKKFLSLLTLLAVCALALTGCVAATTVNEDDVDRPAVIVTCGETELIPTPEQDPTAEATATPAEGEEAEPVDPNIYNPVSAGDELTLTGAHTSGIVSVCYRVNGGDPVVTKQPSVALPVDADLEKLELYVTDGDGIVSQWATFYFTVE